MTQLSANEERFFGKTDSETLQNVMDCAERSGQTTVIIPRYNARTGRERWDIEKCVYLPSSVTVILDDCHLRLSDGVRENIFRNKNVGTALGRTMAGEQHDIRIIGRGNALMDGGESNGLTEQLHRDHPGKYPHMSCNLLLLFVNVRDFEVQNIHFKRSRWWAICFVYCRWGKISDLHFEMHATMENQDGIDLRVGNEYITIENITGITGDDTVALTAMNRFEWQWAVEGKSLDIHDITIRNITSSTHGCALLRFLSRNGIRIYNVTAEDLKDTGKSVSAAAILFGTSAKVKGASYANPGDFRNVVIRNVSSCGQKAVIFAEPVQNLLLENVTSYGKGEIGLLFGDHFQCDDLVIRNFHFDVDEGCADCVFSVSPEAVKNMRDYTIEHVRVTRSPILFRRDRLEIRDLRVLDPETREFDPEKSDLPTPYSRYFKYFDGKEITRRPKENRIDGTLKEDF